MDSEQERLIRVEEKVIALTDIVEKGQKQNSEDVIHLREEIREELDELRSEVKANSLAKKVGSTILYLLSLCGLTFLFNFLLQQVRS